MNDELAVAGLLFAVVGPWALGAVWLHWWLALSGRYNIYILLGHGYLLGMLAVAVTLRVWHAFAGTQLQFWPLAAVLVGLTILGVLVHWLRPPGTPLQVHWEPIPRWHLALIALLMSFIFFRHATLLQILLLQPVFSPDVLSGPALRATLWFHEGALLAFAAPAQWLSQSGAALHPLPVDAALAPQAIALIHLWGMLSIGSADHSFVFLPWIALPVALGLGVFGHLRLARVKTLHAAIATYAMLSLPAFNQHTAMAGYADVWLAVCFTLGACSAYQWRHTRHWAYGLLAVVLAVACAWVKHAGLVFGYLILVAVVLGAFRLNGIQRPVLWCCALLLACVPALWVLFADSPVGQLIPGVRFLDWPAGSEGIGVATSHDLSLSVLLERLFHAGQWHFLWFAALLVVGVGVLRGQGRRVLEAEWVLVLGGLAWGLAQVWVIATHSGALGEANLTASMLVIVPPLIFCLGLLGQGQSATA